MRRHRIGAESALPSVHVPDRRRRDGTDGRERPEERRHAAERAEALATGNPIDGDGREDDADRQMQHEDVESAEEIDEVLHSCWRVAAPSRPPLGMRHYARIRWTTLPWTSVRR